MARIEKDDFEMLQGLIGGVVLTKWKGMPIVKSRPVRKKKPGSAKQLFQQQKMRVAMQFLKPFKGLIDLYFGEPQEVKTRFNLATSYYLQEGLLIEGQEISIAINKVVLTKGGLRGVEGGTITLETPQQLKLTWKYAPEDAGQHPDDQLYVALYVPSLAKQQLWIEVAKRADKQATIVLDPQVTPATLHVWAGFISHDKQQASWSVALGNLERL